MSTPFAAHDKPDIKALLEAVTSNPNDPTLSHMLTPAQWAVLSGYMQASGLAPGQILITQGAEDRTLYFIVAWTNTRRAGKRAASRASRARHSVRRRLTPSGAPPQLRSALPPPRASTPRRSHPTGALLPRRPRRLLRAATAGLGRRRLRRLR